jgi:hypothetical protein
LAAEKSLLEVDEKDFVFAAKLLGMNRRPECGQEEE